MTGTSESHFEALARSFLEDHPQLHHEWRPVRSRIFGDRLDLVFRPASSSQPEVWASLRGGQIAVGSGDSHTDFERFGRNVNEEEIASEAWTHLVELLRMNGYLGAAA